MREKTGSCLIGPRTKQQQEACVSASATVALLRYIRRCGEHSAQSKERRAQQYGYGQTGPLIKQQQEACASASATAGALLRYIRRRDEANAKVNDQFGYGQIGPLTKRQQQACVSASATVGALFTVHLQARRKECGAE